MTLTMTGRLSECVLLAYRTPAESVRNLLPRGLSLITHRGHAFWNVMACRIDHLRPAGLPKWCGLSYHHVAYRLYVRADTAEDRAVEGLHFVRSDADNRLIVRLGGVLTDFQFHPAKVNLASDSNQFSMEVSASRDGVGGAQLEAELIAAPMLAADSCFGSVKEAAVFLKYRPLGLACDGSGQWLKLAEVFRDEKMWLETPLRITTAQWSFLDYLGQSKCRLELATRVAPIDYRWRLGRRARLRPSRAIPFFEF